MQRLKNLSKWKEYPGAAGDCLHREVKLTKEVAQIVHLVLREGKAHESLLG